MQFAVASAAYLNLSLGQELHQVWSQPPGTGKTRTLVSLAYIMSSLGGYKDITLRFTSKLTLQQDRQMLAELAESVKANGTRIRLMTGVKGLGLGQHDTVELIDECDMLILDNDQYDELRHRLGAFIGLTATPLKDGQHSSEKALVTALGISVHDSFIPAMGSLAEAEAKNLAELTVEEFMDPGRSRSARLVYCYRPDKMMATLAKLVEPGHRLTRFDRETYRQMEPGTTMVIEPRHARGLDFRAIDGEGIDLLVTSQLGHDRALVQLLGRVGRYGQECRRYKLAKLGPLVNTKSARACRHSFVNRAEKLNREAAPKEESKEPAPEEESKEPARRTRH